MAMEGVQNERRKAPRFEREELAVCLSSGGKTLQPAVFDLSPHGLGLQLPEAVKEGDAFQFRIELPAGPVQGTAAVRWSKPHHLGYRCGLQITRMSWLHRRRLFYYLRPDKEDPLQVLDRALTTSFFLVALLLALDFLGFSLDRLIGLATELLGAPKP